MAEENRQENTTRRVRVEDADYVLRTEEPNLPRVREEPASGGLSVLSVIVGCAALLSLVAALTSAGRVPMNDGPKKLVFASAAATEKTVGSGSPLGIETADISAPVAAYYRAKGRDLVPGVGIYAADPEGPGAPLRPGDVITAVNGEKISTAAELEHALTDAGSVTLTVYRDGEYVVLETEP